MGTQVSQVMAAMSDLTAKCVIVGAGLTGAASAKHIAQCSGEQKIVLVGPGEGEEGAFGACYDEGRIYRILDGIEVWAQLAEKKHCQI